MYQRYGYWIFIILLATGCSTARKHVLSAQLVSMTHSQVPEDYRLKRISIADESFCEDDKPIYNSGKVVGLVDQAILKAQKKHKATHLADVSIFIEEDCGVISGTAVRAVRRAPPKKIHRVPASQKGKTEELELVAPPDADYLNFFEDAP